MSNEIYRIKERYGESDLEKKYYKPENKNKFVRLSSTNRHERINAGPSELLRQAFLPQGYPYSVSDDYFDYQLYDTMQAFCSRITGTLSTKAILKCVGVGDATATPLSAAITWIFKDGTGMIGSILFAWYKGTEFDTDCKKWRLFADILNDMAMFLEMLLPYFGVGKMFFLCVTTVMKAAVGVCGSATRAAITQHQAIRGNMADVSAKDGSQETFVNLLATFFALFIFYVFPEDNFEWCLFVLFTVLHLVTNYWAVKSLRFDTLNISRFASVITSLSVVDGVFLSPKDANGIEEVILGKGYQEKDFCGFDIKMGDSLQNYIFLVPHDKLLELLRSTRRNKGYVIIPNIEKRTMGVIFHQGESPEKIIMAYFQAFTSAIDICLELGITINYFEKNKIHLSKDMKKLYLLKNPTSISIGNRYNDIIEMCQTTVDPQSLLSGLEKAGWRTDRHCINVDDWRLQYVPDLLNDVQNQSSVIIGGKEWIDFSDNSENQYLVYDRQNFKLGYDYDEK